MQRVCIAETESLLLRDLEMPSGSGTEGERGQRSRDGQKAWLST